MGKKITNTNKYFIDIGVPSKNTKYTFPIPVRINIENIFKNRTIIKAVSALM